jgi:hypothetical protein
MFYWNIPTDCIKRTEVSLPFSRIFCTGITLLTEYIVQAQNDIVVPGPTVLQVPNSPPPSPNFTAATTTAVIVFFSNFTNVTTGATATTAAATTTFVHHHNHHY